MRLVCILQRNGSMLVYFLNVEIGSAVRLTKQL